MEYACTHCQSTEFIRIETIEIDTKGLAVSASDAHGIYKCGNCGHRIQIDDTRSIAVVQGSPQRFSSGLPRTRSSVSAGDRGIVERGSDSKQF